MKSAARQLVQRWLTSVKDAAAAWTNFWFDPADPYTLGIIRLLTGWMLVYNLIVWGLDLDAFFGPNGLQPLQSILDFYDGTTVMSLWFYVPEEWIFTVHWTCVGIAVLFFLGIATRVTSVLAFLITISYSMRVPVANFGLDQILGMLCMYLAVGPSGACLSVDRWWQQRKARERGEELPEPRSSSARTALRLIQLHMCVIYFWAGVAKLKGDTWFTGEAMWLTLASKEYQTMDLTWMAWVPAVPYLIAHVTVFWEMTFWILVWNHKFRPWILLIGTGMHFGIGAFMGMWTFGLIMTYAYFAFSDPIAWRRRIDWVVNRRWTEAPEELFAAPNAIRPQPATAMQTAVPMPTQAERPLAAAEPDWGFEFQTPTQEMVPESSASAADETRIPTDDLAAVPPEASPTSGVEPALAVSDVVTDVTSDLPVDLAMVEQQQKFSVTEPAANTETPASEADGSELRPPQINTPIIRPVKPDAATQDNGSRELAMQETSSDSSAELSLNSEAALLLITLCKNERAMLRRYFRKHDIICKAATTTENGLRLATTINPVAVLVAGTQMQSEELATLLEDLEDVIEAPILALTSKLQAARLTRLELPTRTLQYPVSPGEIRRTLGLLLFGESKPTQSVSSVESV